MLPNTLSVDTGDINGYSYGTDHTYRRFSGGDSGKTTYIESGVHETDSRSILQYYRTFAKRSGNSRGSKKCSIKFTQDVEVPNVAGDGNITLPVIGQTSFSIPEGTTDAVIEELLRKICVMLRVVDTVPADSSTDTVLRLTDHLEI